MARRAAPGSGTSPFKRGKGWTAYTSKLYGPPQRVSGETRAECQANLDARHEQLKRGVRIHTKKRTVGDAARDSLEEYGLGRRSQSAARKVYDAKRVLEQPIANVELSRLSRARVLQWRRRLLKAGHSPDACNRALDFLRRVLRDAEANGWVVKNVAATVEKLRVDTGDAGRVKAFDLHELGAVLAAADAHEHGVFVRLKADAGARLGETLGATWSRLDLEAGRWTIDRQLLRDPDDGELSFGPLKTQNSYRDVLLTDETVRALKAYRKAQRERWMKLKPEQRELVNTDLVFATSAGGFWAHGNFRSRVYNEIIKSAGVRYLPPHSLRHTCASLLLAAGVSLADVAARLGDTPRTVLKTYAWALPSQEARVKSEMTGIFARAKGAQA